MLIVAEFFRLSTILQLKSIGLCLYALIHKRIPEVFLSNRNRMNEKFPKYYRHT